MNFTMSRYEGDLYFRTDHRWAKISRRKSDWYVAKGFRGNVTATYHDLTKTKRFATSLAISWVTDAAPTTQEERV